MERQDKLEQRSESSDTCTSKSQFSTSCNDAEFVESPIQPTRSTTALPKPKKRNKVCECTYKLLEIELL